MKEQANQFIIEVDRRIDAVLNPTLTSDEPTRPSDGSSLWKAAHHTCHAGGKRVRPRLVRYFGDIVDCDVDAMADIAVTAELIHAASLVHDDVIDTATTRRGHTTVNDEWNNITAVLSGDLMFSLAFANLQRFPTPVMVSATRVLKEMSCAVIDEFEARGNLDLSEAAWREIARGKTGALFAWCGIGPALERGNTELAQRFDEVGNHFGVAFQLADDIQDVLPGGDKDRFADLKNQNPSYLTLAAVKKDAELRKAIESAWNDNTFSDWESLGERVIEVALADAANVLRSEVESGLALLDDYAHTDGVAALAEWSREKLGAYFRGAKAA